MTRPGNGQTLQSHVAFPVEVRQMAPGIESMLIAAHLDEARTRLAAGLPGSEQTTPGTRVALVICNRLPPYASI